MQSCAVMEKLEQYHQMNQVARPGGIVFFGSTYASRLPLGEMNQDFAMDQPVYNRSVETLSVQEAEAAVQNCVIELQPSRVFLMLGDADLEREDFIPEAFLESYRWLLYTLHNRCDAVLYIVSALSDAPGVYQVNRMLEELSAETGCTYVNVHTSCGLLQPVQRLLAVIRAYIHGTCIHFVQAMEL